MNILLKINEVAAKYNITQRSLRYYEEIGILWAVRKNDSNYRYYDEAGLNRLEQILLLKSLNFQAGEIKQILISQDEKFIDNILNGKLSEIEAEIADLSGYKELLLSIIKLKKELGTNNINFYEIIKEQIYIRKNLERMINMNQRVEEMIIIEFGENIIPCANKLIDGVKELRKKVESTTINKIPLIRIRDNMKELSGDEYKIIIKDIVVENTTLENCNDNEKGAKIMDALEKAIKDNMKFITA